MSKEYILNRAKYKAIKKLDHKQMEAFFKDVYDSGVETGYDAGYQQGCRTTKEQIGRDIKDILDKDITGDIIKAISEIKGIGPKKLEEVKCAVEEVFIREGMIKKEA